MFLHFIPNKKKKEKKEIEKSNENETYQNLEFIQIDLIFRFGQKQQIDSRNLIYISLLLVKI